MILHTPVLSLTSNICLTASSVLLTNLPTNTIYCLNYAAYIIHCLSIDLTDIVWPGLGIVHHLQSHWHEHSVFVAGLRVLPLFVAVLGIV